MTIDKYATILRLRTAIRAQETLSREVRAEIVAIAPQGPSSGPARSALWQEKRALGAVTRTLLLALAMVRGRAYPTVEQRPRTGFSAFDVALHLAGTTATALFDIRNTEEGRAARDAVHTLSKDVDAWVAATLPPLAITVPTEAVAAAPA